MIFDHASAGKAEIVGFFAILGAEVLGAGVTPAEGSLKPTAGFISILQYSISRDNARAVYSTSGMTRS